ncbi:hypothetical protein [Nakamurella multipartita]|uniref:Uncharacterized protein n=1 Tax=Nakamurella multipartita (strain ATCC 700099 / DSM 44233 / CIP 104796 / JCM 9543 / NBRC 105858 / Y-104) TaxID=479431 RepID=C8X648_NAKMY|nr:hypothetical protein [Nakamurella multipartita]ACV76819.1 hypothetical protein Namu_0393 [Nakamurella multipartita DSM 44233]
MTVANHTEGALDREVRDLLANVACSVPADVVKDVVSAVRQDLEGQVPAEAFPEFLHRSVVQRLLTRAVAGGRCAPPADPADSLSGVAQ